MSDTGPIKQHQCDGYREDVYDDIRALESRVEARYENRIATLEQQMASIEGERKYARFITPILVTVILAVGGITMVSVIKNNVRDTVKEELKTLRQIEKQTSLLMSRYP